MTKTSVRQLIISGLLGSAVLASVGCSVSMTSNTTSNSNTNSAANNTAANKSVNTNTTAQNTAPANTEQKTNTNVASKSMDSDEKEKGDCTVKADNTDFFIEATEKTVKLKKGTSVQYGQFGNQGLAIVKAQIDGKWVQGEIQDEALDCPSDEKDVPVKK